MFMCILVFQSLSMVFSSFTSLCLPFLFPSPFSAFFFCGLGHRRFSPSLSSLRVRTLVRPSRPSYWRLMHPHYPLAITPPKMPPRPRGLNAGVADAACSFLFCHLPAVRTHPLHLGGICDAFFIFSHFYLRMSEKMCTFAPKLIDSP